VVDHRSCRGRTYPLSGEARMTTTLERYAMRRRGRRKAKARRKRAAHKKYEARMAARQAAPPASPAQPAE